MTMRPRFPLMALALASAALVADLVAKYIGSWESGCYDDSGASAKVRADFTKTSGTSFTGSVIAYAYLGTSCSGPSVRSEKVLTGLSMNYVGTKSMAGVTADKFAGSADQKNGKLVLYANGNTLQLGDVEGPADADGYADTFYQSRYTLNRIQ
jgi:hypothetical protein